ncbi:hypothetical protein PR048_014508 [Dryococelus australis]|uniref:Uncharacterized protein n=1 Tax=Dryococelus australis TaxID=614101 RepID=A0ABQ9HEU1_9NEOP|nr:hypothetical protein PR048_014508 [Dryococelus australis]
MKQRRNARPGETGDPGEDPPTSGITRYDSHVRKSGSYPIGIRTCFALLRSEHSSRCVTATPLIQGHVNCFLQHYDSATEVTSQSKVSQQTTQMRQCATELVLTHLRRSYATRKKNRNGKRVGFADTRRRLALTELSEDLFSPEMPRHAAESRGSISYTSNSFHIRDVRPRFYVVWPPQISAPVPVSSAGISMNRSPFDRCSGLSPCSLGPLVLLVDSFDGSYTDHWTLVKGLSCACPCTSCDSQHGYGSGDEGPAPITTLRKVFYWPGCRLTSRLAGALVGGPQRG